MSSGTPPVLKPVTAEFKTDEIEAVCGSYKHSNARYFYVTWRHGKFLDGYYLDHMLQQEDPLSLETKMKKDRKELQLKSSRQSTASFPKKSRPPFCEWKCGDHGQNGACGDATKEHAIPTRDYNLMSALKAAEFCDLVSAINDDHKDCISICQWRHGRTDSHPPKSIMIPRTKALKLIMRTVQEFHPDCTYSDNNKALQAIGRELKEEEYRFVTRYDLDYEAEVLRKTPTDSEDIELQSCDIFHLALKAAAQCVELKPMDRPRWPVDVDGDFWERSELCKKTIALFYLKVDEWLNNQASRREKYDNYLRVAVQKDTLAKEIKRAAKNSQLYNHIVLRSPQNQERSDGPINDIAASPPIPALTQEDTKGTRHDIHSLIKIFVKQYGPYLPEPDNDDDDDAASNSGRELVQALFAVYGSPKDDGDKQVRVKSWLENTQLPQSPTANFGLYEGQELFSQLSYNELQSDPLDDTRMSDINKEETSLSDYIHIDSMIQLD